MPASPTTLPQRSRITGRWYEVKLQLTDRRIRCYLDGQLVHDETAPEPQRFFALAGRDEARGDLVFKCINAASEPMRVRLAVSGGSLAPEAEMTVLTSNEPADNNSLENPVKVVPVTTPVKLEGQNFEHAFPPNSSTLMRIKVR